MSEEKCVKCGKVHDNFMRFMLELSPDMDTATIQHDDYRTEIIDMPDNVGDVFVQLIKNVAKLYKDGAFEELSKVPPALALAAMANGEMPSRVPRELSDEDLLRLRTAISAPVADKDLN